MSIRLPLAAVILAVSLLFVASIILRGTVSAQTPTPANEPTPEPTGEPTPTPAAAPAVTITNTVERSSVENEKQVLILTAIGNGSSKRLTNIRLGSPGGDFTISSARSNTRDLSRDGNVWVIEDIPGLDSALIELNVAVANGSEFGDHKMPISLAYVWVDDQSVIHSAEDVSSVDLKVQRRFEGEIGTVSGGAAV